MFYIQRSIQFDGVQFSELTIDEAYIKELNQRIQDFLFDPEELPADIITEENLKVFFKNDCKIIIGDGDHLYKWKTGGYKYHCNDENFNPDDYIYEATLVDFLGEWFEPDFDSSDNTDEDWFDVYDTRYDIREPLQEKI